LVLPADVTENEAGPEVPEADAYTLMTRGVISQEEYEQLLAVELKAAYELMQQGVITMDEYERLLGAEQRPLAPTTPVKDGEGASLGGGEGGGEEMKAHGQEDVEGGGITAALRRASAWFSPAQNASVTRNAGNFPQAAEDDGYDSDSVAGSWKRWHRRQIAQWKKAHPEGSFDL
jgi:hypothetical protein